MRRLTRLVGLLTAHSMLMGWGIDAVIRPRERRRSEESKCDDETRKQAKHVDWQKYDISSKQLETK
jgi:hypothetical protein